MPNVRVIDRGGSEIRDGLEAQVLETPLKGGQAGTLTAWICGACGYTEIYAANPNELFAAYEKRKRRQG